MSQRKPRANRNTTCLYFAYGSNLDPAGMAHRCPAATVAGRATLAGWRLTFRGVADVEPAEGETVEGLLWDCTDHCVQSLDIYEGVSGGFYRQEWLQVKLLDGTTRHALVYVMNPTTYDNASMPSVGYLGTIQRGYLAFGLPLGSLDAALQHAEKRCNRKGVRRWTHDGRKRMRPATSTDPAPEGRKKPRKTPRVRHVDLGELTDADARAMGISPATLADLRQAAQDHAARRKTT